jgi:hypothetical protein
MRPLLTTTCNRFAKALLASAVVVVSTGPAKAEQIWLSAVTPYTQAARHWNASVDYMDLFRANAQWNTVAKQVDVFKIGPGFAISGNREQLTRVISGLRERNIALALESGLLAASIDCPKRDEAHISGKEVAFMLDRIRTLGGVLRYVAVDEPVTYGRRPRKDGSCAESLEEIAQQLAPNISLVRSFFPDAQIGTNEVVGDSADLVSDVEAFASVFQRVTGHPLAFLHADVDWSPTALENLTNIWHFATSRRIAFGVIYDAVGGVHSDREWTESAQQHIKQVEVEMGIRPDAAIFQTWVQYPTHLLPEDQPGTLTNVVLSYLKINRGDR